MATVRQPATNHGHLVREAEAIAGGAFGVFLALSLLSYGADAPRANWGGPVGHILADVSLQALGLAAYLFPAYLGYLATALLRRDAKDFGGTRLVGAGLFTVGFAAFAGLLRGGKASVWGGGWLGGFLGMALRDRLGGAGATLVLLGVLILALVLATRVSALGLARSSFGWLGETAPRLAQLVQHLLRRAPGDATARALVPRQRKQAPPILLDDSVDDDTPPPIIREP